MVTTADTWATGRQRRGTAVAALVTMLAVAGSGLATASDQATPVRALPALDLEQYAGRWFEVARFPNRFQQRCTADVTASYALRPDGKITVVNTCLTAEGERIRAEGRAKLADGDGPASRLKVRFAPAVLSFLPMVWADYWVLDLADGYRAALVGTPDRRYLWVLSREPELDEATYDRLVRTAAAQGFDVARLQPSGKR